MKKSLTFIILSLGFTLSIYNQTLVNKCILSPFGNPSTEIEWSSNIIDNEGNLLSTGHTVKESDKIAILTTKQSPEGEIVWQKEWMPTLSESSKNYGVGITLDNNGNIIIVGATTTGTEDETDYVAIKYSSAGTEIWAVSYAGIGGKADIPSALIADNAGNIFVTGASMRQSSDFDYWTLKLSSSNGSLVWENRYDYAGLKDIPVAIELDNLGNPVITGVSAENPLNYDFATLKYHLDSGNTLNENRIDNTSVGFDLPTAIIKDATGNFYVTGNSTQIVENQNIQIIKLDGDLNVLWTATYDGIGFDDGANSIQISNSGNVLVTGYTTNQNQQKELIVLSYNSVGDLEWEHRRKPADELTSVEGKRSSITEDGAIYVAGEISNEISSEIITIKVSALGKGVWERRHTGSNFNVQGIKTSSDGIFVFCKEELDVVQYFTLQLKELQVDNPTIPEGRTFRRSSEVIVKFNKNELIHDNINNLDIKFGPLNFWLNTQAVAKLDERIETENVTLVRIFKRLKTTHTTSITRTGKAIPIPDFWAAFIMLLPEGEDIHATIESLESTFPLVKYAHPNYVAQLLEGANDEFYDEEQPNLHPNGEFPDAHVGVESAWDITSGKPSIKVGVIDTGLDYEHEDFTYQNNNVATSVMVDGWDFETEVQITTLGTPDEWGYGTGAGGIIGAVKNNETGIAGIAGGFPLSLDDSPENRGVSLYAMRIFQGDDPSGEPFVSSDLEYIADAIFMSAVENPNQNFGYGLHIMNNSWSIRETSPQGIFNEDNIQLLSETVHFANRNEVVFVAGRGNDGTQALHYPAVYDDPWVISVTGTDQDGFSDGTTSHGAGIDVGAPSISFLVKSLQPDDDYNSYNGTSASAAHVSGLAGLILSDGSATGSNSGNLAPEDVEFIIQEAAFNPDGGYDDFLGHGKIDCGKSLELINFPNKILHFDSETSPSDISFSLVEEDIELELAEDYSTYPYYNVDVSFQAGDYLADVYKIDATVTHPLVILGTILHSWERHSASTTFELHEDGTLLPHEKISLDDINNIEATLSGYTYRISDLSGNFIGWLPFDPNNITEAVFAYSVLVEDFIDATAKQEDLPQIKVFPNPTSDFLNLEIENINIALSKLEVFSFEGKVIFSVSNNDILNTNLFSVDIKNLPPSVYYIRVYLKDGQVLTQKFIKL